MAMAGDQFECSEEICGVAVSIRYSDDRIEIWVRNSDNSEAIDKIRASMGSILGLTAEQTAAIEFKRHDDSLKVAAKREKKELTPSAPAESS